MPRPHPPVPASCRVLLLFCTWLGVSVAAAPRARATPQDIFGFGARTPGMAMTGASYVDDFEGVFANPAGLAGARRMALVLGLTAGAYRLRLDGSIMPTDASQGMTIGFQLPLPFTDELENVFVLGAGFFTPTNTVLRNNVLFVETPQWPVVDRAQVVALQMAAGIDLDRWVPGLRIGGGVSAMAQNSGRLIVELDPGGDFASVTEVQLTTTFSPVLGVQYQRDRWALGVTYRGELRTDVALDVQVNDLPVALPELTIDALAHFDPHTPHRRGVLLSHPRPHAGGEPHLSPLVGLDGRAAAHHGGQLRAPRSALPRHRFTARRGGVADRR
jgi:hypothetical protein